MDTWTGPNEGGEWRTASDWSTGSVPGSSDLACVEAGVSIAVDGGTSQVGALLDEGTLVISSGSLELTSASDASSVSALTISGGTLTGAGRLTVSGALSWTSGTMSGSGATVALSGATATVKGWVHLAERQFVNEGTASFEGRGWLYMSDGAQIKNTGTFETNTSEGWEGFLAEGGGAAPSILNTGTFEKVAGSEETEVRVGFENDGSVESRAGQIEFRAGGSGADGEWSALEGGSIEFVAGAYALHSDSLSGAIDLRGASVTTEEAHGSDLALQVGSGSTLSVASGWLIAAEFTQTGGTVEGGGTLDVSGALSWTGGTMSGSGSTVVLSGASGAVKGGVTLAVRELVNEGTTTLENGGWLHMAEGAEIKNTGTFKTNTSDGWDGFYPEGSGAPSIINTGVFEKAAGSSETEILVNFENHGTVSQKTGLLLFERGTTTLYDSSVLEGSITIKGATVLARSIHGQEATLTLSSGSLSVEGGKTAAIGSLKETGGTVEGGGTLDVSGSLSWTGGTMSGSGSTVVLSGASGGLVGGVSLAGRRLVNEGTSTLGHGGWLRMSEGAEIKNTGTFKTNTSEGWDGFYAEGSGAPSIVNSGTFEKVAGSEETEVRVGFENEGSVESHAGQLQFRGGGSGTDGEWSASEGSSIEFVLGSYALHGDTLSGTVDLRGAAVSTEGVHAHYATVYLASGSLSAVGADATTVGSLTQTGGSVEGAGTLDVSGSLSWTGGMMSGSGSTVILPGASATLKGGGSLEGRQFVNEGTATLLHGWLLMSGGARIENAGTFEMDTSEGWDGFYPEGSDAPSILNTGTFEKTTGSEETEVKVNFVNDGRVLALAGELMFDEGGVPGQAADGSWSAEGGSILFKNGTFVIMEGTELAGVQIQKYATVVWVPHSLSGSLGTLPLYVSGTVKVGGSGEGGISGPFAGASVEVASEGGTWVTLCGSLTPGLAGEFECSWETASSSYPDGTYQLRAKLSGGSPTETLTTNTVTAFVDNTPPAGSLTAPASGATGGFPMVMGTASDSESGVASWQLQIAPEGSSEWASACAAQTTPLSGDEYGCVMETVHWSGGSYRLRALISDQAGNTYLTSTVGLQIDNAALGGSLTVVPSLIAKTVEVEGTATATGPGVESWALQIAPAGGTSWSSACAVQSTPVSGSTYGCSLDSSTLADGDYQLRAVITSDEGHTRTTAAVTTIIDNTAPTGAMSSSPSSISGSYEVQGHAEDSGSGVATWTLQLASAGSETWTEPCLAQTLAVFGDIYGCTVDTSSMEDGEYKVRAVIVDNAGNTYTTPAVTLEVKNTPPSSTADPAVSGVAIAGRTLSATTGTWSGPAPIIYAYQWRRCNTAGDSCANIEGASGSTYTLATGDVASTVRVLVTASNGAGSSSASSPASAVIVADTLANISLPAVGGSPHAGGTLEADPGEWSGALPISYGYQWQHCNSSGAECANITGASTQSYTPTEAMISSTLCVTVTVSNSEGSLSETSAVSPPITASAGSGIRYLYEKAGRLSVVDDPSKGAAVYQWDPDGNLLSIERYSQSTLAVLALRPEHAPPGTTVDITGTGFNPDPADDTVTFDGTSATVTEASATDLIATVPLGAGTGLVTVTVSGESAKSKGDFSPHDRRLGGIPSKVGTISQSPAHPPAVTQPTRTATGPQAQSAPQPSASAAVGAAPSHRAPAVSPIHHTKRMGRPRRRSDRTARHSRHPQARGTHHHKHDTHVRSARHRRAAARSHAARDLGHTPSSAGAGQPGIASSTSGGLPAAVSAFRPSQPATWAPTAANRRDDDWVSGRAPSPWATLPALEKTQHRATTALSGQALVINGMPLANVTLSLQGTSITTKTDRTGRFLLTGLPAGHQALIIDGESADHAGQRYGQFTVGVELTKDKTTPLGYTIWMTPLDPAGNTRIQSPLKHETTITNLKIPGLEVRLPAGTVVRGASGAIVHKLNLTAVPLDRPPFPLPPFISGIPTYFTVQPGRAYLNKGAQIIYPNWGHLPPGQRVDFWNYDPSDKGWYIYGKGSVSANGKQVIPDPDVRVWEFTGAMISGTGEPPLDGPVNGASTNAGDPVDLASGLFVYQHTDLDVPDSMMPVSLTRTYRQVIVTPTASGWGPPARSTCTSGRVKTTKRRILCSPTAARSSW